MAHHPKWKLIDKKNPTRKVVGRLRKAYIYLLDGDLNFQIQPYKEYEHLIEKDGIRNADGRIECEVETLDRHEDQVFEAFEHGIGGEFTAYGVWVNDTPHGSKFELHPLDALFTRLRGKHIPDWTSIFKEKYKGTRILVHRVFASADQSDKRFPPLADRTRTTVVEIPYPNKPRETKTKQWRPEFKSRIALNEHCKHEYQVGGTPDEPILMISITPRCFKEGEAGLMLFDVVTYWKPEILK